ncbi:MAG TPA: hypothetical protein VFU47_10150, partial [Armatimonadota bacterium]|nr:hypothetical protein [Armatimonadota bacterium]
MSEKPHRRLHLTRSTDAPVEMAPMVVETAEGEGEPARMPLPESTTRPAAYVLVPVTSEELPAHARLLQEQRLALAAQTGSGKAGRPGGPIKTAAYASVAVVLSVVLLGAGALGSRVLFGSSASAGRAAAPPERLAAPAAAMNAAQVSADAVLAGADGGLALTAAQGTTHGDGINKSDRDIGYWNSPQAYVTWIASPAQAGTYAVDLTYACAKECGGKFEVTAGEKRLQGLTEDTGGWDRYKTVRLGVLELPKGPLAVRLRPLGPVRTALMSLTALKFYPVAGTARKEQMAARR